MKFLCPSCKAKYQLADEKVAGRSVRMKCRKCGHMIHVSSADAIANSSAPPPDTGAADASPMPVAPQPEPVAPAPAAAPVVTPAPAPVTPAAEKSRPRAASSPQAAPAPPSPAQAKPGPAASATSPSRAVAPRAAMGSRPEIKKPATSPLKPAPAKATPDKAPPAKPAAPAKPAPAKPALANKPAPLRGAANKPANAPGTASAIGGRAAPNAPARAASGGVSSALKSADLAAPLQDEFGDEEPTHIAEPGTLASALAGAFSEAVRETHAAVTDPLNLPGDEWFVGINGVPVGPIRLGELRARAASGAVGKESLVWRDGFEEWRPLKSFPELVAIVEESLSSAHASLAFAPTAPSSAIAAQPLVDPFKAPAAMTSAPAASTGAAVTEDLEIAGVRPRGGTSAAAWIAMVVAMLFGITVGFVLFGRSGGTTPVAEKRPEPSAPSAAPAAAKAPEPVASSSEETVINADPHAPIKSSASTSKSAAKSEGDSKLSSGLKGLGLSGLSANGPKGPSDSVGSTNSGSGQLEASQLQATVARYTPSVKRSCWQPALDTKDKDAPGSARVSVAITVGPSGSVQNASASPDPHGYRGLSNCISSRVRGWQFPASGGTTTVNVPFVFVAQ